MTAPLTNLDNRVNCTTCAHLVPAQAMPPCKAAATSASHPQHQTAQRPKPQDRCRPSRDLYTQTLNRMTQCLYELTGHQVKRRVRQHQADADLEGLPGWSVEVKRYASTPLALVAGEWWQHAAEQARRVGDMPVLFYRPDGGNWRTVWPAGLHITPTGTTGCDFGHTLTADPLVWWRMCKGLLVASASLSRPPSPTRAMHWAKG